MDELLHGVVPDATYEEVSAKLAHALKIAQAAPEPAAPMAFAVVDMFTNVLLERWPDR